VKRVLSRNLHIIQGNGGNQEYQVEKTPLGG